MNCHFIKSILIFALFIFFARGITWSQETKPVTPTAITEINRLYQLDTKIRNQEKELLAMRKDIQKKILADLFEQANKSKEKANKLENEIKYLKDDLTEKIEQREAHWLAQPTWQRMAWQPGLTYTFFDNDLHVENRRLLKIKIHWLKEKIRPFHAGYIYNPLEQKSNAPLRRILASSFILEYRQGKTKSKIRINNKRKTVQFNAALIGFGLAGQTWNNTYLGLNITAGVQRFSGTEPNDTGPIVSYTIGLQQKFSEHFTLGVELTEDILWSKANQSSTSTLFNFSSTCFLKFKF